MANEELDKKVYVRTLKEELPIKQIAGDDDSLNRWIIVPDVNRPGMELTGYHVPDDLKRVNILGNKEVEYMNTLDKETLKQRINMITDIYTPCIIISSRIPYPEEIVEIAKEKNFPVFRYSGKSYEIVVKIVQLLSEKMAPTDTIHGVMMNIYGVGVLLSGDSGIGKSELGLDLIKRGHMLVSDDRVDIANINNDIKAHAPSILKGMLEVRGLGVVDVALLFGAQTILDECNLDLVIKLVKFENHDFDRLNIENKTVNILGVEKSLIEIPVSEGRPVSAIVEAAVTDFILKRQGVNTALAFKANVLKEIEKNKV